MTTTNTNLPAPNSGAAGEIMERVFISGDLSRLTPEERTRYYMQTCESIGVNPLTKPFDYVTLNGKMQLYALKACTDQLRGNRNLSVAVKEKLVANDILTVTVEVTDPSGRRDEDYGAVNIKGLQGDALANATMKALTKAKRRATLSFCGLGMLDETELETIPASARNITPPARRITSDPLQATAQAQLPPPTNGDQGEDDAKFLLIDGDGVEHGYARLQDYLTGLEVAVGSAVDPAAVWSDNAAAFEDYAAKFEAAKRPKSVTAMKTVRDKINAALADRANAA